MNNPLCQSPIPNLQSPIVLLLLVFSAALAFGEEQEKKPERAKVQSKLLINQYLEFAGDLVADAKAKGGQDLPAGKTDKEIKYAIIDATLDGLKVEGVFKVYPVEEERFKVGKFDDEGNKKRVALQIEALQAFKVELPAMTRFTIEQFKAGKLTGLKLELAVRLLDYNVNLLAELWEKMQKAKAQ